MNEFSIKDKFDRVVSVEMIEHMRNHKKLFKSIVSWLKPKGMYFMHIFVHQSQPYLFEVEGDDDWMGNTRVLFLSRFSSHALAVFS
ncbi:MAG: class I SAM-dependent methyltransferase [Methylophilaceae bacterium]|nr:class I SAM-dependent methyltransferase [Methylophilaceae bacterium]